MQITKELYDFFLPRFCSSCNLKLTIEENILCTVCFSTLKHVPDSLLKSEFQKKFEAEKIITDFASLFLFESDGALQKVIHELKYSKKFSLGIYLGKLIAENLKHKLLSYKPNLILPVPIHKLRKAERGYNQSYYIAKGIGKRLNIEVKTNLLKRERYTKTQTALNFAERKSNVSNAFALKKNGIIAGKRILIVDDVITTGATVTECGKELLKAGAEKVFAVSVGLA